VPEPISDPTSLNATDSGDMPKAKVCDIDKHQWILSIGDGTVSIHCAATDCWDIRTRAKTSADDVFLLSEFWDRIYGEFPVDVKPVSEPAGPDGDEMWLEVIVRRIPDGGPDGVTSRTGP